MTIHEKIAMLRAQGVELPAPEAVEIGDEVDLTNIRGPGTILHGGTKLYGEHTLIHPGVRLGYEEPVTVENCALGPGVTLGGGYFSDAVLLDGAAVAKGGHVRSGTLLEEQANGAHTVGLKQTILLPFVTLGSLINFCDILMAGGTSRRDHSEVGSSFIHFNFTPFGRNGDKATPSLIGDVPRGVMLRSARIFLGGQGGLVGPLSIDYGTVLAAGCVYRRDYGKDLLVVGEKLPTRAIAFSPLRYGRIRVKVEKNLRYIGNLMALNHWYSRVRLPFAAGDNHRTALYLRAQKNIRAGIKERIKRLGQIAGYMEDSIREIEKEGASEEILVQRQFAQKWPAMERELADLDQFSQTTSQAFTSFNNALEAIAQQSSPSTYLDLVQAFDEPTVASGTAWLDTIVEKVINVAVWDNVEN